MSAEKPSYMLAPNWDFPPSGPIALGSLILNPRDPKRSLNKSRIIPIPDNEITTTNKEDWSISRDELLSGHGGIWANFLAPILGVGGDISAHGHRDKNEEYKCKRLETKYFDPEPEYIRQSLLDAVVKTYTQKFWGQPLYMVTGVKIAHKASADTTNGNGFGGEVKLGVDGTPAGAPVSGGPKGGFKRTKKITVKFGASDDFVIGYRVLQIKAKGDGSFSEKDYNRWALLDDTDEPVKEAGLYEMWDLSEVVSPVGELGDMKVIAGSEVDDCNLIIAAR